MFHRLELRKFSEISAPVKTTFYPARIRMRMVSFGSDNLKLA